MVTPFTYNFYFYVLIIYQFLENDINSDIRPFFILAIIFKILKIGNCDSTLFVVEIRTFYQFRI